MAPPQWVCGDSPQTIPSFYRSAYGSCNFKAKLELVVSVPIVHALIINTHIKCSLSTDMRPPTKTTFFGNNTKESKIDLTWSIYIFPLQHMDIDLVLLLYNRMTSLKALCEALHAALLFLARLKT